MPEKKLHEIANVTNLHASRMSNQNVTVGDITIELRPLTMRLLYFAQSADNIVSMGAEMARLGIVSVQGMDAEYETIDIMGKQVKVVTQDWFLDLNPMLVQKIQAKVNDISYLGDNEAKKLDFT